MLLEDYPMPGTPAVREAAPGRAWAGSRFAHPAPGIDVTASVASALDEMDASGGWHAALECVVDGQVAGSLVVFKDPWYRSKQRDDVACFGLVTARDERVLRDLLDKARDVAMKRGCSALRGPVNPPRSLLGYGVQVSGFDAPLIAGTSANKSEEATPLLELDAEGYFDSCDRYYNLAQDFDKTLRYIATFDLDRSFRVVNPDLDHLGDLPARVAALMNDTLGYRADYQHTSAERLAKQAQMYRLVPGGEKLMAFFFDGDTLAGGVIMQPDWFQVLSGQPATTIIGDIYMLAPAYQGRRLFMNCSEYSMRVLQKRGTTYYEHASIHEGTKAVLSSVKNGYARIVRECRVYEVATR
ncbi:MAG: hypothetical protein GYA24_13375 [Candidatus Lokiarchaeota archaeon]|nr:hypothetical protein [Candidatus Lokiarchaeota archaeon]